MGFWVVTLLALALTPAVLSAEASLGCPGEASSSLSLDTSNLKTSFYLGVFMMEHASSASDCLEKAMASQCDGVNSQFFIYSLTGFTDPHNSNHGNCAFGAACVGIKDGDSPSIVGKVPKAECTRSKAEAKAASTQQSIPCPVGMPREKMSIDDSSFHELSEQGLVTIVSANTARGCRRKAREATCSDMPSGFFIFNPKGFKDPSGFHMGECALFPTCFGLEAGESAVTVGNVKLSEHCLRPSLPHQHQWSKTSGIVSLRGQGAAE